jgi:hypothetical protein
MKKLVQHSRKIAVEAARAEAVIKNQKEMETLWLLLEGQQKIKIEEAISEDRIKFQNQLEGLHSETRMWLHKQDNELCKIEKQKSKLDVDKMGLEAQRYLKICYEKRVR